VLIFAVHSILVDFGSLLPVRTVNVKGSFRSWGTFPNKMLDRSPHLRQLQLMDDGQCSNSRWRLILMQYKTNCFINSKSKSSI